jgi:hypothetical protein
VRGATCRYCGARVVPGAAFCGNCGEDLALQEEAPARTTRMPTIGAYVQPPPDEPIAAVLARIVGLFVIVGLGLALGVLLFGWVAGFFGHRSSTDVKTAIIGGIATVITLVFAMLIGVVLAAIGGHYAASHVARRDGAVVAAGIGSAVGHFLLIVCIAASLVGGIDLLSAGHPTATPPPDNASCVRTFGANSPLCGGSTTTPSASSSVDYRALAKGTIGVVPAGLVGAFVAMTLFDRRRERRPR